MNDEPTIRSTLADTAGTLTRGLVSTPAILGLIVLNIVMVGGWMWLLINVAGARASEIQQLFDMLMSCMRPHT